LYDKGIRSRCTGKERDAESGLDYFGARYFSGPQGRFTGADPALFPHDITDPQSWNKYVYTRNNPLRYVDPDGADWQDVLKGVVNAFASNNVAGAGRISDSNGDFKTGQAIGDAISTVTGAVETAIGSGGEALGIGLDATGVGAVLGVPLNVAAAGLIVHGATTTGVSGVHLAQDASDAISSGQPYENTPQNQDRMAQGKAPVGKDGKPVELHHEGQTSEGDLKEMTQSDHRGGENFSKNHPNTGQEPSQIDRSKFKQQREQYWKDKAKKPDQL
jgi:RHS repeat-associated protein